MQRFENRTPPILVFAIAALTVGVILADLFTPLGLAVWVFYLIPLGACLFTRSPMLPLYVGATSTLATVFFAFTALGPSPIVDRWIGLTNRSLYVATLWPVAYMVRQLMLARQASEREQWLRSTHARLIESLQGELLTREVAERALRGIVQAFGAQVGALYVGEGVTLERAATHALSASGAPEVFRLGEGLLGQAAETGELSIVRDLPEGFLRIEAGVGRSSPRQVVIAPLRTEGKTIAVAAIGAMSMNEEIERAFFERVSEPIAISIVSSQYKARLKELLEESRRQTEELESQQAELKAQQAELEAQQTELEVSNEGMARTNALMEAQTRELERQRDDLALAREAADRASRYKSEFLANMSHELRTPLNSSLILARLLADNKEGNLDADQVRSAETIYSAGNDLLVLINDILDLAKIESGHADVVADTVSLAHLSQTLERAFAPVAKQKNLVFRVVRASGCPDQIVSDERRIEQILKNLLSNAFKFTSRGDVELTLAPEGKDKVRFSVRDSGIGIALEQQEVIFEAFRQADGTTSRKYGGTGLGLSISRELSRLLGGDIGVESVLGKGSTFSVVLPLDITTVHLKGDPTITHAEVSAPPPNKESRREGPRTTEATPARSPEPVFPDDRDALARPGRLILVVEDDIPFARTLYALAHELDFDCVVVNTADDGVSFARTLQPSGVLLDVGLPDATGLSVLERLKRDPSTRHIPIHVVSASDNTQTALELGAIGYAIKPTTRDELVSAMKKLQERYAREVRRVLVVEDDVMQQESIKKLLGGHDVEVLAAGSVKDALEKLEQLGVDCMVLDLTLPDGSGYDILQKMAEGDRYSFPPVIVYTGRDLARADEEKLRKYSRSIIVKGARSPERLLDEVTLFLHQVESTLPPEKRRMLAAARQAEAAFEGRRILVVEDDVRNVFALSKILEPRGAKVEIARNGREALDVLGKKAHVDLVLMDLMMPEMDGLTAIREIRKQEALKRLPIIALTAKAMTDDRDQAIAAGANDYMSKPFEVDKLVSLCRVWLPR